MAEEQLHADVVADLFWGPEGRRRGRLPHPVSLPRTRRKMARWFAVAVLGLNAIDQMLFIPAYPLWSLMIIAVDVVALYGLCAYGSRANLEAAA
jgi:hypothetical protein